MSIKKIFAIFYFQVFLLANNFNYKSFQTDFEQIIFENQNILKYSGEIFYKDEKSLWKYKFPDEKLVYITKDEVVIIDDELEQIIITKENIDLKEILKNLVKIDEGTYLAKFQSRDYLVKTKNNFLNTIDYKDDLDNKVKIIFKNSKVNINLDDNIFEYKIPSNYDILR